MLDRLYEFNYVPTKTFLTELEVKDFKTEEIIKVVGPRIYAESMESAQKHLESKGINYIRVVGELVDEYSSEAKGLLPKMEDTPSTNIEV